MNVSMETLKALLWEEAKGKLRAFAAVAGSYPSTAGEGEKWREIDATIEAFCRDFEDRGLHE